MNGGRVIFGTMKVLVITLYLLSPRIPEARCQVVQNDLETLPDFVVNTAATMVGQIFSVDNFDRQKEILRGNTVFSFLRKMSETYLKDINTTKYKEKKGDGPSTTTKNDMIGSNKTDSKMTGDGESEEDVDASSNGEGLLSLLSLISKTNPLQSLLGGEISQNYLYDGVVSETPPLVSTAEGVVRGVRMNKNGVKYSAFMGIPYAAPPIRFQAPKPPIPWTGIKDATKDPTICWQKLSALDPAVGSEDCLHLNIHTPSADAVGLPVLVLIHGGGFRQLSGNSYLYSPENIVKENIIYISFNYRLGALGFLATKTSKAPGNAGMKDMIAALRWIKKNVHMFGGDPSKVTLYGGSTGSMAVEYITLSKMAENLFSQTIMQSGSVLNYWAYTKEPMKYAYRLGHYLGFNKTDINELMKVLNEAKAEDIVEASEKIGRDEFPAGYFLPFVPCVENLIPGEEVFLRDDPEKILESGDFIKIPSMIGFNNLEGSEFAKLISYDSEYLNSLDESFEYLMPTDLMEQLKYSLPKATAMTKVRHFYLGEERISNATIREYCNIMGDSRLLYGIFKDIDIRLKTSSAPIYLWQFDYNNDYSIFNKHYNLKISGAAHGDDIGYVFAGPYLFGEKKSDAAERVSQKLTALVSNFVKYGNPTPTPADARTAPFIWMPIQNNETLDYMRMTDALEMKTEPYKERMLFWKNLYADG